MAISIDVRWAGPSDAASGSTYKIEQTLDWDTWTELDAAQAATSPYVSPTAVLDGNVSYGDTSIDLVSATDISSSGYGIIDNALVQWTGKSTNTLTGATWHSGYGTYATGTTFYEAHESYADSGITPTDAAVVYRITHTDADGNLAAPGYFWFYYPDLPESGDHCVLIVQIGADIGVAPRSGVAVRCYLAADDEFAVLRGLHLDQNQVSANEATTNDLGIALFQLWRSAVRSDLTGAAGAYTVRLDTDASAPLDLTIATVPDRDWVLLQDVAA